MTKNEENHTREDLRTQIMEALKRADLNKAFWLHVQLVDFELARLREEVRREKGNA